MLSAAAALGVAPVLVPLATAFAVALASSRPRLQLQLSFLGAGLLLACALGLLALVVSGPSVRIAFGGWPHPFGIEFAIDRLAAVLVLITALVGVACLLFLSSDADPAPAHPTLLPQLHGLLAGVGGAFVTADLFNLYVWLEATLICSLGLLALGGGLRHLDATFRYLLLSLFGTLLLLIGVALLYGATGQLNFAALARAADRIEPGLLVLLLATLGLALLLKAGAFPLFAWLPAAYPVLPAGVLALFAGLLTKVGVYALLRLLGDVFAPAPQRLSEVLGWIAAATMLAGVLGAAHHWDMRRILAFHIVSQVGYMLLGIALATPSGNAAALFYTVHHILVKSNLFLIAGMIFRMTGDYDLRRIGGLYAARPGLAILFLVPALSLVGVPPLSGFWAKLLVLREAFAAGRVVWAAIALGVRALTLYSVLKIWIEAFWKPHPDADWRPAAAPRLGPAWVATAGLALLTLALGLLPQGLLGLSRAAAADLGGGG